MTTIRQPIAAMCAAAVDLLIEGTEARGSEPAPDCWLDYELIVRGSTLAEANLSSATLSARAGGAPATGPTVEPRTISS